MIALRRLLVCFLFTFFIKLMSTLWSYPVALLEWPAILSGVGQPRSWLTRVAEEIDVSAWAAVSGKDGLGCGEPAPIASCRIPPIDAGPAAIIFVLNLKEQC